jgi:crotonobetainyl-CoA:carnitine CoA-transferase CaiB-like acyl-CoA transferase
MSDVLKGIRVVEISAWAFVPSAGAVLADWGAEVLKIEPPTGDPIRGLVNAGVGPAAGLVFPWEIWNRGKKGLALDLSQTEAQEIVMKLVETADVFLTSYLPPTRRKLGIDIDDVRKRNPTIIYACGSGQGAGGPEADKGGYDSISFWSRGSVSASVTPPDYPRPVGMPAGAFGDSLSGMSLAGGIAAALVKKGRTGEGSIVDGSLLGTAMWCMQMGIVGASVAGPQPTANPGPRVFNPLVNNYRTSDNRWVALCMLQPDVYFEGLCRAIGREDMVTDSRFDSPQARAAHLEEIIAELEKTFATRPIDEWRAALATQKGQWDVVNRVVDVIDDPQARVNGFVQEVAYSEDRSLAMVASPVQFDRTPPELRPAPGFGADTDEVLQSIGMDQDAVLEAKISGAVI